MLFRSQPTFTNIPPYGSPSRVTNPGGAGMLTPPLRRPARRQQPISYIIMAAVLLIALVLVLAKTGVLPIFNSNSNPSSNIARPFTENFQTNDRNWTNGTINHLTATISGNGQYALQISNAPVPGETDFPHPQIGTLPNKFTLTVTMEQTQGDGSYGLAFHESEDTNGEVSCYALIIYAQSGSYQVLKYIPNLPDHYTILGSAKSSAITTGYYKPNKLQVIVDGGKFSFSINDQPLSGITPDSAYSGGQLAVLVSGTNASFVVQQVALATS